MKVRRRTDLRLSERDRASVRLAIKEDHNQFTIPWSSTARWGTYTPEQQKNKPQQLSVAKIQLMQENEERKLREQVTRQRARQQLHQREKYKPSWNSPTWTTARASIRKAPRFKAKLATLIDPNRSVYHSDYIYMSFIEKKHF